MNQELSAVKQIAYLKAKKRYEELIQEYDVVLPPEPLFPITEAHALSGGNYAVENSYVDYFIQNVVSKHGINQKVCFITIDTGAFSRNRANKKNFVNGGQDHTGENQPVDENGHFSFCDSQIAGHYGTTLFGAFGHPDLPSDFWFHTGEKGLRRSGSATWGMLNQSLTVTLDRANKYAAQGFKVFVNCSWGGGGYNEEMAQIFTAFRDAGHFVFTSAGNSGSNGMGFPAKITPDDVGQVLLAIGAVDENDNLGYFSSIGKELDFVSYGVSNYGAGPGETDFRTGSGTSFSCPMACGLSALLVATFPEIENLNDLEYVLKNGAIDLGDKGFDNKYGHGIIKLNQYDEEDLPTDDPDNPDEPIDDPNPEPGYPVFPNRILDIKVPGTYHVRWAILNQKAAQAMGIESTGSPFTVDLNGPNAKAYDWQNIYLSEIVYNEFTDKPSSLAAKERTDFTKLFFPEGGNRGVVMTPPVDDNMGGEIALYFARMFANKAGGEVLEITATCEDENGYQTVVDCWQP